MYFLHILIVPSSSPQSVTAIATSSTSITVTWEGIPQKNKNGVIIAYEVEFTAATISVENTTVLEPPLSLELTGLYEAEIYRIRVRGYTSVGPGPFSSPLEEETPEDRTYLMIIAQFLYTSSIFSLLKINQTTLLVRPQPTNFKVVTITMQDSLYV